MLIDCAIRDADTSTFFPLPPAARLWRTREVINRGKYARKSSRFPQGDPGWILGGGDNVFANSPLIVTLESIDLSFSRQTHVLFAYLITSRIPFIRRHFSPFRFFFFSLALALPPLYRSITASCHDDRLTLSGSCCIRRPREISRLAK